MLALRHGLRLSLHRDEKARVDFVSALRRHVFETVAGEMRCDHREAVAALLLLLRFPPLPTPPAMTAATAEDNR